MDLSILVYIFRKLLDKEPSFVTDCRMGRNNLYVVTEAFEVTKDTVVEGSSSIGLSGKALVSQLVKVWDEDMIASPANVLLLFKGFWGPVSRSQKGGVIIFHCLYIVYANS